jgi:hypothetical protein
MKKFFNGLLLRLRAVTLATAAVVLYLTGRPAANPTVMVIIAAVELAMRLLRLICDMRYSIWRTHGERDSFVDICLIKKAMR